jgi:hypothetical protein
MVITHRVSIHIEFQDGSRRRNPVIIVVTMILGGIVLGIGSMLQLLLVRVDTLLSLVDHFSHG